MWPLTQRDTTLVGYLIKESAPVITIILFPYYLLIGVGFTNGLLGVLDSVTLKDVCQPFRYSREAITKIVFSHDSTYMATAVS